MGGKNKYQFFCNRRLLVFLLTGITFAFTLVFILGFLVGKESDEGKPYGGGKEGFTKEDKSGRDFLPEKTERDSEKAPSDLELTFYQSLIRKEAASPSKAPAAKTQRRAGENKARKGKKEREVVNDKGGKARSLSGYTLQVGSFQNKERARELVEELKSKGYETYIISSNIPMKGLWHRVRIGHFKTLQEAKKTQLTVEMKERLPVYVTFISN